MTDELDGVAADDRTEHDDADETDLDAFDLDEIAAEGNRVVGARARAVVEHVARHLADDPDAIEVAVEEPRDGEITLVVHANPDDLGRLIGRRGRVVQALRQVARAAGSADGVRVSVDIAQ